MLYKEVSRVYAGALLELGEENNLLNQIEEELGFFSSVLNESEGLMLFLNAPVISKEAKKKFIDKIFKGKFCVEILSFLKVSIDNDRQSLVPIIHLSFLDLLDERNNRKRVKLVSSVALDGPTFERIKNILNNKLSKNVIIEQIVDESILGGIIIRIDDTIIDGSILKDLNNLKDKIVERKVESGVGYED